MQKKKNIRLAGILLVLIIAIITLHFSGGKSDNLGIDKNVFQLSDQQEITDVYLKGIKVDNHFSFQNGRWVVNDKFILDQSMRDVFFSVLSRVEVRKPIAKISRDSIASFLKKKGVEVRITFGEELVKHYWVGGNQKREISWMMDSENGVPYQIHIPGYQSYIAGIYMVPTMDWRSRFILDINFALITDIKMSYPDSKPELELQYDNKFFSVTGVEGDSTKIANFLDQLAYLQADQFIGIEELSTSDKESVETNSLYATLAITKSSGEIVRVKFYSKPADSSFIIARLDDNSLCLVNYERIKGIFQRSNQFE